MAIRTRTVSRTGARRAAALLVALGNELAAPLLRELGDEQVEAITREIVRMDALDEDERDEVVAAAYRGVAEREPEFAGEDFARDMLSRTMGTRKAEELIGRVTSTGTKGAAFDFARETDMAQMVAFFEGEHPQSVALALAHMPPDLAGQVLSNLSPEQRIEVAKRLASTSRTDPHIVERLESAMREKLATHSIQGLRAAGGMDFLVEVLSSCDSHTERSILESIGERDADLASQIRERMFAFDDVAGLDDRSIQRLLREVDRRDLVVALRGASEGVKTRIFRNMSVRSARNLQEECDLAGALRLRLVEDAQGRIVAIARRLQESEEIVVPRGRDDVFVP